LVPGEEGVGVVTPHNAQKALIGARTGDNVDVDTVERFQGDERECIVVSAAVSDPSYLDLESDFIMNPNRLNVALSRMKKKLVVVAPESLFELVPQEKDAYQDAQIWKGCTRQPPGAAPPRPVRVRPRARHSVCTRLTASKEVSGDN